MTTALLVIDAQNDVLEGVDSALETVGAIARAVEAARVAGCPIVWVQHDDPEGLVAGSPGWQLVPDLVPEPQDVMIGKQHRSAFAGTGLADTLRSHGVNRVVVTGAQSAFCVDMAGKHALAEGFDVVLVQDGHCNGPLQTDAGELSDAQVRGLINRTWSSLRHPDARVQVVSAAQLEW